MVIVIVLIINIVIGYVDDSDVDNENENDRDNGSDIDNDNDNDTERERFPGSRSGSNRWTPETFAPPSSLRPPASCLDRKTSSLTSSPSTTQPADCALATGSSVVTDSASLFFFPNISLVAKDGGMVT